MKPFADIYSGRRVLVTGHTGFKGSWLGLWLKGLGAEVIGIAIGPATNPNHWDLLGLNITDLRLDIRDHQALHRAIKDADPEIVFHLAAQPLVRRSYRDPLGTWATNVLGTANLLEACRHMGSLRAIVVVTSDKCYLNHETTSSYCEDDRLGGHDPYSASKAAAELLVASYRSAFFEEAGNPLVATARAGNVIGGGDWSEDRLIPDLIRAVRNGKQLEIRSPNATRPWQHVLESLSGYLLLGQKLLEGRRELATAWNFGPNPEDNRTVTHVLEQMHIHWPDLVWHTTSQTQPHEAALLQLDSTKARQHLKWHPVWRLEDTIQATAEWYRGYLESGEIRSAEQLVEYLNAARTSGLDWCGA